MHSETTGQDETTPTIPSSATAEQCAADELVRPGRDAAATKRALIRAARRRFATEGYRATTVRQIAADAGVNVALINRYFVSKDGLFEACIRRTSDELESEAPAKADGLDKLIERLVHHVYTAPDSDDPLQLVLLLRSSGDDRADQIRRRTLEEFTAKLAARAGWREDAPETAPVLLRAQLAIATMVGTVMLRTSVATEPIASASLADLTEPLSEIFCILLAQR